MNDYLTLSSFVVSGNSIAYTTVEVTTDAGTVALPRPFIPIGPGLAVTPAITTEGQELRIRLDAWIAMHHGLTGRAVLLPMSSTTQAAAVRAARDFTNDSAITWTASPEALLAWCHAWIAAQRPTSGED